MPELFCRRGDAVVERRVPSIPVTCAADALGVLAQARHQPDRPQVLALVLDDRHTIAMLAVEDADHPDAVIDVVELVAESLAAVDHPAEIVLASIRRRPDPLPGDAERWMEISTIAEDAGSEILDWFVISGDVAWCPRDLFGEPPRW